MKRVVLLGGGHAHVEVLRRWREDAPAGTDLVLVSPGRWTPYSGMLPGHVEGRYAFEDFHIDLRALCARSGARLVEAAATGLHAGERQVMLDSGERLGFDLLSLDIGSTPLLPEGVTEGLAVKPISTFTERLVRLDARVRETPHPFRIAVVGQGVAGVEIAFAIQRRFADANVVLVGRASRPIPERGRPAQKLVAAALAQAGIETMRKFDALAFDGRILAARDGRTLAVDEVVWTTASGAPSWLRGTDLALDERGFVRVDACLRCVSHPHVLAAGDVAALPEPRAKSGVIAVRAGPVLAHNIAAASAGRTLAPFRPQRRWLALISLADGRAIADKWGLAAQGRWVARWKHWNDSAFVKRYAEPRS